MNITTVLIPYPPSANRLWRTNRRGKMHKTDAYTNWAIEAGWALKQQKYSKFTTPVSVELQVGPPDRRKRDLDNVQKATFDLLEHLGVIENDNLIHRIHAYWDREVKNGILVTVSEMAAQ